LVLQQGILDPEGAVSQLPLIFPGNSRWRNQGTPRGVFREFQLTSNSDKVLMVGVMGESFREVLRHLKTLKNLSVDFLLVQTPGYFRKLMTHEVIRDFFLAVADEASAPILLYNAPGFNGITLTPALVTELKGHPNIAGMKDRSPEGFLPFSRFHAPGFAVMPGSAEFLYPALLSGLEGGTISPANYLPEEAASLWRLGRNGDSPAGQDLHRRILAVNRGVSGSHGVTGVKAAMELIGFKGGDPRLPLKPLGAEMIEGIRRCLEENGFLGEKR